MDFLLWIYHIQVIILYFVKKATCESTCYTGTASSYTGHVSVTITGTPCQRWDVNVPHNTGIHPMDSSHENYCRDPSESGFLWCYTLDPDVRWDYCPPCGFTCYTGTPSSYRGVTVTGTPCQRWDVNNPHNTGQYPMDSSHENYCRDPSGSGFLWCYTTDPDVRWDYCSPCVLTTTTIDSGTSVVTEDITTYDTESVSNYLTDTQSVSNYLTDTQSVSNYQTDTQSVSNYVADTQSVSNYVTDTQRVSNLITDTQSVSISVTNTQTESNLITDTQSVSNSITNTQRVSNLITDTQSVSNYVTETESVSNSITDTESVLNSLPEINTPTCFCSCTTDFTRWFNYFYGNLTNEEKAEIIRDEKERIMSELLVDKKKLSSYKRKKTCAKDDRPVAVTIGSTLGIGVIVTLCILVVLGDLPALRVAK